MRNRGSRGSSKILVISDRLGEPEREKKRETDSAKNNYDSEGRGLMYSDFFKANR